MAVHMLTDADKRDIRAVIEEYRQAVLDADWETWGSTRVEDVFLSPAQEAPRHGRDSAVEWVLGLPPISGFTVDIDELDGAADVACARGRYELVMKPPDGSTIEDSGSWLQVDRRPPDGTWLYTRLLFHSTSPLPE